MNIGKGIKTLLKKQGLTQKELANQVSLSETSLSLIIKNKTQPRKETIESIASTLGVKPEVLFLLSLEKEDIPKEKKEYYDLLWPSIENNLINLFTNK